MVATPQGKLLPSSSKRRHKKKQKQQHHLTHQVSNDGNDDDDDFELMTEEDKLQATVKHVGMPECSKGLRVKPFAGGGALFYHKLGNGVNDELSSHGGCPPNQEDDPSWKINGFMWNMDSGIGPTLYSE